MLKEALVVVPVAVGVARVMGGMPVKQVAVETAAQEGFVAIPVVCVISVAEGVLKRRREDRVLGKIGSSPVRG